MPKAVYHDEQTSLFQVRIRRSYGDNVKEVAARLGIDEIQAKREIVEAGLKALNGAA